MKPFSPHATRKSKGRSHSHPRSRHVPRDPPSQAVTRRQGFGCMKGKIWIAPDFDAPLPEDVMALFEAPL